MELVVLSSRDGGGGRKKNLDLGFKPCTKGIHASVCKKKRVHNRIFIQAYIFLTNNESMQAYTEKNLEVISSPAHWDAD